MTTPARPAIRDTVCARWARETRLVERVAAMTTQPKGRECLEEIARASYIDGVYAGVDLALRGDRAVDDIVEAIPPGAAKQGKRAWSDITPAQQAAIRCGEADFQRFIGAATAEEAADKIRARCGVASRKDIVAGTPSGEAWRAIDRDFAARRRER